MNDIKQITEKIFFSILNKENKLRHVMYILLVGLIPKNALYFVYLFLIYRVSESTIQCGVNVQFSIKVYLKSKRCVSCFSVSGINTSSSCIL